jgi:hypothetical protein
MKKMVAFLKETPTCTNWMSGDSQDQCIKYIEHRLLGLQESIKKIEDSEVSELQNELLSSFQIPLTSSSMAEVPHLPPNVEMVDIIRDILNTVPIPPPSQSTSSSSSSCPLMTKPMTPLQQQDAFKDYKNDNDDDWDLRKEETKSMDVDIDEDEDEGEEVNVDKFLNLENYYAREGDGEKDIGEIDMDFALDK